MDRLGKTTDYLLDEARTTLQQVDPHAVDRLLTEIDKARHVVIFGRGRSGRVAQAFAIRLGHLGYRAFFVGETSTPPVRENDLVLLVSGSGETFSVTLTGKIANDMDAPVIAITASPESELADTSDHIVHVPIPDETKDATLAPLGTRFEFTTSLLFEGIIAELMHRLGEDEESMSRRHATLE